MIASVVLAVAALFGGLPAGHSQMPGGGPVPVLEQGCAATEGGWRCLYGPIEVPGGGSAEAFALVPAPPAVGYVTSARATLVDTAGRRVDRHVVHLHHAVWANFTREDLTCGVWGPGLTFERFFASGKERTPLVLPPGHGYFWSNEPADEDFAGRNWGLAYHLDGMHEGHDLEVFIRLNLGFVAAPRGELTDVVPVWLDVRNCSAAPVFDVPTRRRAGGDRYVERWEYTMPVGGRFVALAGHLHDGGTALVLRDLTAGRRLFVSRPTYGRRWDLKEMSSLPVGQTVEVAAGHRLRLAAKYSTRHRMRCERGPCAWDDVMGIMLGALVPAP